MKKTIIASAVALVCTSNVFAADSIHLDEVTVKANRFERKESETTYASEIHTAKQIEASGAATLYDYLAQQTSLNGASTNRATSSVNLRGYGSENGSQNVVLTVDGQRLNNIDGASQLLTGIPLSNIERIEISKGSGSVIYGDGATAGAIQIYTKAKTGVTVNTSWGNFGQKNHAISAGFTEQYIDLSATLAHDSHDGFSKQDETGHKDQFTSNSQNAKIKIKPTDRLNFFAEATSSRNDTRYVNALTKAEFQDNPRQVTQRLFSQTYTHQALDSDRWQVGSEFALTKKMTIKATHFREDKTSDFINFLNAYDYDYEGNELSMKFADEQFSVVAGLQNFDGDRTATSNVTTKDSVAYFVSAEHAADWLIDGLTVSAGARKEKVSYKFKPETGSRLNDTNHLTAWDVGANYKFTPALSMFANYNQAFQSPDVDRFFNTNFMTGETSFNSFIEPAKVRTINFGFNHTSQNNRLKISAFHANLDNEIYLFQIPETFFFKNTNFDESYKYGLEVQDFYAFNDNTTASVIYNYTRAKIDREDDAAGAYNGKDLPGVPKHTVVANLNIKFLDHAMFNLNQTWRAKTYAYNDFENNFEQKQGAYQTTNLALSYQYKNMQFYTAINNLFAHENSIQVLDDAIYPVDFVRTWRVGMKADF